MAEHSITAKPVIKWAGGKQRLLNQFEPLFPAAFDRYFEPFLGSGAVFYHLWTRSRLCGQAHLWDNNEEIINLYLVIRDRPDALIQLLRRHKQRHDKAYYYAIRGLDRQSVSLEPVARAARTLYLNRTCYNGLYRVNSKGQFNTPIGRYVDPAILHEEVLRAAHQALQGTSLRTRDFRAVYDDARPGDFIYFDPPYHPLSATANFRGYTADSFYEQDQRDLAHLFTRLSDKGCLCMLSNSHTLLVRELYAAFRVEIVHANRAVNSVGNRRGTVEEVVVLNY